MKTKYIVVRMGSAELLFTFPAVFDHDKMAVAISHVYVGSKKDWDKPLFNAVTVSAGFINASGCHGRSETLGLDSRGAVDDALRHGQEAK